MESKGDSKPFQFRLELPEPMPPANPDACDGTLPGAAYAMEQPAEKAERPVDPSVPTPDEAERVAKTKEKARSASTRRHYSRVFKTFAQWCEGRGVPFLPAPVEMVEVYIRELADRGLSLAYIRFIRSSICHHHLQHGYSDVAYSAGIADTVSGLATEIGRPQKQARGLRQHHLDAIEQTAFQRRPVGGWNNRLESEASATQRGLLDIAIIYTMRNGMLRRVEAAALTWDNLIAQPNGTARLLIVRSKTDRAGNGRYVYLGVKTLRALNAIMPKDPPPGTSTFGLSDSQICRRIRAACRHAGLGGDFSGHSPRVGMAQDMYLKGIPESKIMEAGRWNSLRTLRKYLREIGLEDGGIAQYERLMGDDPPEQLDL